MKLVMSTPAGIRPTPLFGRLLIFILGAATAVGGSALVHANSGGLDLAAAEDRAIQVAAGQDVQWMVTAAESARVALAGDDHALFLPVAAQTNGYTDGVGTMRSALGLGYGGTEPEWYYTCFYSTGRVMHSSADIFKAAAAAPTWSDGQTAMVRQTVADLDQASRLIDMVANGGAVTGSKSDIQPNPSFDPEPSCASVVTLADTMSQLQWPN